MHSADELVMCFGDYHSIAPEEVKGLLLLDDVPAHPDKEKHVSADEKICTMFLPPNTTSIIQPMDLGEIVSCKGFHQQKLGEVLVVIEEEEDTRGQRSINNIKSYNIKSAIYNFASAWKDMKMTTLSNLWKK